MNLNFLFSIIPAYPWNLKWSIRLSFFMKRENFHHRNHWLIFTFVNMKIHYKLFSLVLVLSFVQRFITINTFMCFKCKCISDILKNVCRKRISNLTHNVAFRTNNNIYASDMDLSIIAVQNAFFIHLTGRKNANWCNKSIQSNLDNKFISL